MLLQFSEINISSEKLESNFLESNNNEFNGFILCDYRAHYYVMVAENAVWILSNDKTPPLDKNTWKFPENTQFIDGIMSMQNECLYLLLLVILN